MKTQKYFRGLSCASTFSFHLLQCSYPRRLPEKSKDSAKLRPDTVRDLTAMFMELPGPALLPGSVVMNFEDFPQLYLLKYESKTFG